MSRKMTNKTRRHYYIDWLRVLAVMLLFVWHSEQIFDIYLQWYVKNDVLSPLITHLIFDIAGPWFMPLFFLLAGASTWYALQYRDGSQYVKERFKRLLIPFIFGVIVLIPPQPYFGLRNHSTYSQSFLSYYPQFFRLIPSDINGYFKGGFTPAHLWFIFYLFVFSLITLPFLLYLRNDGAKYLVNRSAVLLSKKGMVAVLAIPLIIANFIDFYPNPLFYVSFFIYGYILQVDKRFEEMIDNQKLLMLTLGPGIHAILLIMFWAEAWSLYLPYWDSTSPANNPRWFGILRLTYINNFVPLFTILAMLGYGKKYLKSSNRFLRYFSEASYPFYIIHQTVIVVVGFYIVKINTSVLMKYSAIVISAFIVTTLFYDIFVKRLKIIRFLFGMKPL